MQISKKYFFMSVRNVTNIWLRSTLSEGCDKKVLFPSKAYQLFSFVLSWFVVAQGMSERENGFSWTGLASEWKINTKVSWCAAFKASKNLIFSRHIYLQDCKVFSHLKMIKRHNFSNLLVMLYSLSGKFHAIPHLPTWITVYQLQPLVQHL